MKSLWVAIFCTWLISMLYVFATPPIKKYPEANVYLFPAYDEQWNRVTREEAVDKAYKIYTEEVSQGD